MLNPTARINVTPAPQITVYRDHEDARRFYVLPVAPRLRVDGDGLPDIHLLLYGHGPAERFEVSGGQLTLQTSLAFSDGERLAVATALQEVITAEIPPAPGPPVPPPPPDILPPDWLSATVSVDFGSGLRVEGRPSLMGDNECALSLPLSVDGADLLQRLWQDGLKDAVLEYRGEVSSSGAAARDSSETSYSSRSDASGLRSEASSFRMSLSASSASSLPVTLTGPIQVPGDILRKRIEVVAL